MKTTIREFKNLIKEAYANPEHQVDFDKIMGKVDQMGKDQQNSVLRSMVDDLTRNSKPGAEKTFLRKFVAPSRFVKAGHGEMPGFLGPEDPDVTGLTGKKPAPPSKGTEPKKSFPKPEKPGKMPSLAQLAKAEPGSGPAAKAPGELPPLPAITPSGGFKTPPSPTAAQRAKGAAKAVGKGAAAAGKAIGKGAKALLKKKPSDSEKKPPSDDADATKELGKFLQKKGKFGAVGRT